MREPRLISRDSNVEEREVFDAITSGAGSVSSHVDRIFNLPTENVNPINNGKLSQIVRDHERLRDLKHQNLERILRIYCKPDSFQFIVTTEYIDRHNLDRRINGAALLELDIRLYSKQICSALAYLHDNDVIHRNICSRTIIIMPDQVVKLIDYGISIQLLDEASRHLTGCPRGQPRFMAPELCQSDSPDETQETVLEYSRGSDTWAFGCVVFHMATGRQPFEECRNMIAIVRKICAVEPPALPDTCSDALRRFHAGCVVRERHARSSAVQLEQHEFIVGQGQLLDR